MIQNHKSSSKAVSLVTMRDWGGGQGQYVETSLVIQWLNAVLPMQGA